MSHSSENQQADAAADRASSSIDLRVSGRIAILLASVLSSFAIAGINPVLPAIQSHFADTPHAGLLTRLLVSVISVMIVIGSPLAGLLADGIGRRRTMLTAMLVYAIGGSLGFVLDDLHGLIATRVLVGLAAAAVGALVFAIVATHSHGPARNRWLGYVNTVSTVSTLILIPASGYLARLGWQWPFLIHAIALPLFVLAFLGLEPDAPRVRSERVTSSSPPAAPIPWALLALAITGGMLMMAPLLYVPFHLQAIGVTDPAYVAWAMLPTSVGTALTAYLYGRVRTRLTIRATFVVAFAFAMAGLHVIAQASTFEQVLIGQTLLGCGAGLLSTNIFAVASMTGADVHRARQMGIAQGGMFAGPLVAQLLMEPFASAFGPSAPLTLLAWFAAALLLAQLWSGRREQLLTRREAA